MGLHLATWDWEFFSALSLTVSLLSLTGRCSRESSGPKLGLGTVIRSNRLGGTCHIKPFYLSTLDCECFFALSLSYFLDRQAPLLPAPVSQSPLKQHNSNIPVLCKGIYPFQYSAYLLVNIPWYTSDPNIVVAEFNHQGRHGEGSDWEETGN